VHVTIVKPHEPVTSARIAGQVLCHCAISCHLPQLGIVMVVASLRAARLVINADLSNNS
jgi:hypothetical protein